ncbi:MAG: vWA domain-containing protein [Cyanobacteria bacterium P01_A01_bin.105]
MTYRQLLSSSHPGYLILLVDQSASMTEPFANGRKKADECAKAVNRVLRELGLACTEGDTIHNRCDVSVIGYGRRGVDVNNAFSGMLGQKPAIAIQDLVTNVMRIETLRRWSADGDGGTVEIDEAYPIWIDPVAGGSTPMALAFEQATQLVQVWTLEHPASFPPIVINITDGEPNDPQATHTAVQALRETGTDDGHTLIFNIHISSLQATPVALPDAAQALPDGYGRFLFELSSPLPTVMVERAHVLGLLPTPQSKGMVYNADADTMIRLLDVGARSHFA